MTSEKDARIGGAQYDALAKLPQETSLDARALACHLGVHRRTIRRMEDRRELPAGRRMGGRKHWIVGRILEYWDRQSQVAERDAETRDQRLANLAP